MKPYQALIWNEWRQMRGSALALAGVTVLLWLLLLAGYFYRIKVEYIETAATALAIGLPFLYSIVLADSFAREFSQKTDSFLLEMPVSPNKIFFCKYFTNLAASIALVIIEVILMSPLICLTPSRQMQLIDWLIGLAVCATAWLAVHAMIFLTSLLGKKSGNGIVSIIIFPLPVLMLLPGTMAATMFFIPDERYWLRISLWLSMFCIYVFCVLFGWYLWKFRLSRGKKILKPVFTVLAIMLIAPWIFHGMAYFIANMSFNAAIREANAAGIETDIKKLMPQPVSDEQNAAPGILKFYKEYSPVAIATALPKSGNNKKVPNTLPSNCYHTNSLWNGTDFFYSRKTPRKILPRKEILETSDFILNDSLMNQCYITLSKAIEKPYCQFKIEYADENYSPIYFRTNRACGFLVDRAYALRVSGRDNDFFACLAGIDKIANALIAQPFGKLQDYGLMLKTREYQTAIAAGPDTVEAIKFYDRMIRDIDSISPVMDDKIFQIYNYLEAHDGFFANGTAISEKRFLRECSKLCYGPRLLQGAAAWIRWKIDEDKLLKQAPANASLKTIESEVNSWRKKALKNPTLFSFSTNIWHYFGSRTQFEAYKLSLALKIYHIKYGQFPDSLQKLVSEILPKIPVNPMTGKDYIYQPEPDGFHLSGYRSYGDIKYQTWKIAPEKAK
jgi:ABC-type transport system involved in multi-copper enzyme maturation permease subunit